MRNTISWTNGTGNSKDKGGLNHARQVTPTDGGCTALVKLGTLYLDQWTTRDYFPDQPAGIVFPVWVKVERMNEKENQEL